MKNLINRALAAKKKIFSLAVVCCLALVGAIFVSCNDGQKSSYQYLVQLAAVDQDEKLAGEFMMYGLPIINEEMQKASDQQLVRRSDRRSQPFRSGHQQAYRG